MKLISWNINGIRSALRVNFLEWLESEQPDILSLQEIKAHPSQLPKSLTHLPNYHLIWNPSQRPGYSGVAVFCKEMPLEVIRGVNQEAFDCEGRLLCLRFPKFWLLNAYFPHARRDLSRLPFKQAFNSAFLELLKNLRHSSSLPIIACGDFNVAHTELDLTNDRANRKNAGFLPEERVWMDRFLEQGLVDCFRDSNPDEKGHYTWWSQRKGVRERNIGWRIDYHLVDARLNQSIVDVKHLSQVQGSDHCPILLELSEG